MDPVGAKDLVFRKLCTERFISSICYCLLQQYLLVSVFILFINFSILHPISWLVGTFGQFFSLYFWVAILPLAVAVAIHGVVLAKSYLVESRYYPTLFLQLSRNFIHRSLALCTNASVGFLSALFYTQFLRDEYRLLFVPAEHGEYVVLNECFVYLVLSGCFSGCYYFIWEQLNPVVLDYPIFLLPKPAQYWNSLRVTVNPSTESMRKAVKTLLMYMFFYCTLSTLFLYKLLSNLGGVQLQDVSTLNRLGNIVMDIRLLFFTWLFSRLIMSNLNMMHVIFRIFLNEPQSFNIETSSFIANEEPLLANALEYNKIPIIQQLAAEDLLTIAEGQCPVRRNQLFALTVPGGHPNNWRRVHGTCMKLIQDFSRELNESFGGIEVKLDPSLAVPGSRFSTNRNDFLKPLYNRRHGIRNLQGNLQHISQPTPEPMNGESKTLPLVYALKRVSGYDYLFKESKFEKCNYLMRVQSHLILKIVQSLAAFVSYSLYQDTYGVLQDDISPMVHTLLELKRVVDKVGTIHLDVRKRDRDYVALRGAIKRSLYKLTKAIEPYIETLITDHEDVRSLRLYKDFCAD